MKLIITLLILMLATPAFAELTTKEEDDVRLILGQKQKLIDLAKTQSLATVPLEIEKKRKERVQLIAVRDGEIAAIKATALAAVDTKHSDYEPLIDAIEAEIQALENSL